MSQLTVQQCPLFNRKIHSRFISHNLLLTDEFISYAVTVDCRLPADCVYFDFIYISFKIILK